MGALFGIGGSAAHTDRSHELQGWGDLENIFGQAKGTAVDEQVAGNKMTNQGRSNLTQAANYWKALGSGNPAMMSKVLAPQISLLRQQTGQSIATRNQFAGRSGGTAAANIASGSEAQSAIQNLFDLLGPQAMEEFTKVSGAQTAFGQSEQGLAHQSLGIASDSAAALSGQAGKARETDVPIQQQQQAAAMNVMLGLAGL